MRKWTLSAVLALSASLTGCSSDDETPPSAAIENTADESQSNLPSSAAIDTTPDDSQSTVPPSLKVQGKAIDGYISGGTVFLDLNGNGIADENEPQKVTEAGGNYQLDVPNAVAECVAYSALIVDVPVGAKDEGSVDEGIEPHEVSEPYQIVLQPTFTPIEESDFTDGLVRNISPLTTEVWNSIEQSYPRAPEEKTCDYLKQHEEAVQKLQQEITSNVNELVKFYNLSADQIYADFIADKNSEAFHAAQDIMLGLKAAYKRKSELKLIYPEAEVSVLVYRSEMLDREYDLGKAWYRDEVIFDGEEDYIETAKLKDSEALDEVDFHLTKLYESKSEWSSTSSIAQLRVRKDIYRNIDGTYRCGNIERIMVESNQRSYELSNTNPTIDNDSIENCTNEDLDTPYERSFHIRYSKTENDEQVNYSATFFFRNDQTRFTELSDWINIQEKTELDPQQVVDSFEPLPYQWEKEVDISTSYWRKRKETAHVTIDTDDENQWKKYTKQEDGTTKFECSVDGQTWTECAD